VENQKVHIRHVMHWEFKQGTSGGEMAEKMYNVEGEADILNKILLYIHISWG
jgi:hypothetical protein